MLNLVPTGGGPISQAASDAQRQGSGILEVRTLSDYAHGHGRSVPDNRQDELTTLRQCLNELLNPGCRICLGGKIRSYDGKCPGVAEEAYYALKMGNPLYLIGGFGGATAGVYESLEGEAADSLGKLNGLLQQFPPVGLRSGLSRAENARLYTTTDIEAALGLISNGMNKIGLLR